MPVEELDSAQLRHFIQSHQEGDYLLVDVRQPAEYEAGHIPGARLMPLPGLARSLAGLPADKDVIFYCRVGGRSAAAALMLDEEEEAGRRRIFNLAGGIMSWEDGVVPDLPQIRHFENQTSEQMLKTAMNLEKGALLFYRAIEQRHADQPWISSFTRLGAAEIGHARRLFEIMARTAAAGLTDFETCFDQLDGEILEGGLPLTQALAKLSAVRERPCMRLVEMALQIERAAFDLYRTMADRLDQAPARQTFLSLAQAEKSHMQVLIEVIPFCR